MVPELETPCPVLRPLQLSDSEAAQRLFPHWEIVRYLAGGLSWPFPDDGVLTYYQEVALPAMERGDAWHWGLRLKDGPDHLMGSISLLRQETNNRGFWMGLPWQGMGLMSEAVIAANDYWFDVLGFKSCERRKPLSTRLPGESRSEPACASSRPWNRITCRAGFPRN